jgi:hypothetical protein
VIPRPKNCVIMATGSLGLGCSAEGDGTDLLYQAQGVVVAPSLHELAAYYSVYAEAYRNLAGRLGGARGLPGARALGLLSIVGLRRWQKLDPAFAAHGRQPLEIRRRAGQRRVARVVDRLP